MRARTIVGLVLLAGCTATTTTEGPQRPAPASVLNDVVAVATEDGSLVVDAASGSVLASDAGSIAAPDGSRLYSTAVDDGATTLVSRDATSGQLIASTTFGGTLDARVASASGRVVALMEPLPEGVDATIALPRRRTTIVVADPAGHNAPRRYRLDGNYEPEAFSVDHRRLFMIQYLPAEAPSAYRVTSLDLPSGRVHPVFGRFKSPPERMPGVRLSQVFDPASEQLFTLYTNRAAAHFHDSWDGNAYHGNEVSFVHVLNLRDGWAFCAGLPRELWGQPAATQAMAPSPGGTRLYVVDSAKGIVAELNTRTMRIARTATVTLGSGDGGRTSAVMSADGGTLFVTSARDGDVVYGINVDTLRVRDRWALGQTVSGLALSSDGARLYAAVTDGVAVLDAESGDPLREIVVEGAESILHVASSTA